MGEVRGDKNSFIYNYFFFLKDKKSLSHKSKIRVTNRCVLTNRSRGILRPYGISRVVMRDLMQFGVIPGYYKAVW